jgi:predicted Fe-Mo cluster-binding NifX family protein
MKKSEIRVAFPSEDGSKISRHFGKAPYFVVATIQKDGSVQMEQRLRNHWHGQHASGLIQFAEKPSSAESTTEAVRILSADLFAGLEDCQVLVAGGMGQRAYEQALALGLQIVLTGEWEIHQAVDAYRNGVLSSDLRRIHKH